MLRDDRNESSAVYLLTSDNKHAVCGTDFSPMEINFFAKNISDDSSLWWRLSITCQARKMIKFHQCSFWNIKVKQIGQILLFENPIFFRNCVVPENIQTPTTEGIGNSRGVGGSEAQEIPEGRGVGP